VAGNFQTGNKGMRLLTEYENVFGNVVLAALTSGRKYDTLIFHKQFYFVVSGLKIIGYGNPDCNVESPCISVCFLTQDP
jgi:hypothetical protein